MGKKPYTQKKAEEFAKLYGYTLLDAYVDYHAENLVLCPNNHKVTVIFYTMKKGVCRECSNERMREKNRRQFEIIEDFFDNLRKIHSNIQLLTTRQEYEQYKGKIDRFHLTYICYLCNKPKNGRFQDAKDGSIICKSCSSKLKNQDRIITYNLAKERFAEKQLVITTPEDKYNAEYENSSYIVDFFCLICNSTGVKAVRDILTANVGCATCNKAPSNDASGLQRMMWSDKVKLTGNYTCFNCGYYARDSRMHAHHLFSAATFKNFSQDIDNGVCLCENCHTTNNRFAFHRVLKKDFCTPLDFINWLLEFGEKCAIESNILHFQNPTPDIIAPKNDPVRLSKIYKLLDYLTD